MKIMKEVEKDFRVMKLPTRLWPRSWFIMAKFNELKSLLETNLNTVEPHTGIRRDWCEDTDLANCETIQQNILGILKDGTEKRKNNLGKIKKRWLYHKHHMARKLKENKFVPPFFFKTCAKNAMEIDDKLEQLAETIYNNFYHYDVEIYSDHLAACDLRLINIRMLTLFGRKPELDLLKRQRWEKKLQLFEDLASRRSLPSSDTESDSDHEAGAGAP